VSGVANPHRQRQIQSQNSGQHNQENKCCNPFLHGTLLPKLEKVAAAAGKASAKIKEALSQYRQGKNNATISQLNQAETDLNSLSPNLCSNLRRRIADGLDKARRSRTAAIAANTAIRDCDGAAIDLWKARFECTNHPARGIIIAKLSDAKKKCADRLARQIQQKREALNRQAWAQCRKDNPNREVVRIRNYNSGNKMDCFFRPQPTTKTAQPKPVKRTTPPRRCPQGTMLLNNGRCGNPFGGIRVPDVGRGVSGLGR
jgi:hypothetical protein